MMTRRDLLGSTIGIALTAAAGYAITPSSVSPVPVELTVSGSMVGADQPTMAPRIWAIETAAQRRRVWPTFAGRRWTRETPSTYVIREDGLVMRLRFGVVR